jgi:serine/threonine-protein kinase HipA
MPPRPPLEVYISGVLVGHLTDADGACSFAYINDPKVPRVSCALPWHKEPYPALHSAARAVIDGWLPEDRVRTAIARQLGVDSGNQYALLEHLGIDCAGAVQIVPAGTPLSNPAVRWLTDDELIEIVEALPRAPLGPRDELRVRASLAGAQGKLTVVIGGDRVGLPSGGEPSSHILKPQWRPGPDDPQWHDLVANEAFCMRLAAAAGLSAAHVTTRLVGQRPVLVIERFDRQHGKGGTRRTHQEDLGQASGIHPTMKYEDGGSASLARLAQTLPRTGAAPVQAFPALLDAITIAAAIGNADQHAKNLAVIYAPEGARLAPLYNLVSTMVYDDLSRVSALRVGGAAHVDEIGAEACIAEARSWGMPERLARERLRTSITSIHGAIDGVLLAAEHEGWATPIIEEIANLVRGWPKRAA